MLPSLLASACICSAVRGINIPSAPYVLRDICLMLTEVEPLEVEVAVRQIELVVDRETGASVKKSTATTTSSQQQQQPSSVHNELTNEISVNRLDVQHEHSNPSIIFVTVSSQTGCVQQQMNSSMQSPVSSISSPSSIDSSYSSPASSDKNCRIVDDNSNFSDSGCESGQPDTPIEGCIC